VNTDGVIRIYGGTGALIVETLRRALQIARDTHRPVVFDANDQRHFVTENGYVTTVQIVESEEAMPKAIIKCWIFASSSGSGTYETLQYEDGSTSCACMGWTRRIAMDGSRSCKHTRSVDMGNADQEALRFHDYSGATPLKMKSANPLDAFREATKPQQQTTRKDSSHAKKKSGSPSPTGYGKRRLIM
jgi:hypothetical protein